jgi:hypothetical protein
MDAAELAGRSRRRRRRLASRCDRACRELLGHPTGRGVSMSNNAGTSRQGERILAAPGGPHTCIGGGPGRAPRCQAWTYKDAATW